VWITTSTPNSQEVLVAHRNAPLSETGRLRLARCVVDDGWPLRRAAERFQVSHATAARWAARYRHSGAAGMADRSSRAARVCSVASAEAAICPTAASTPRSPAPAARRLLERRRPPRVPSEPCQREYQVVRFRWAVFLPCPRQAASARVLLLAAGPPLLRRLPRPHDPSRQHCRTHDDKRPRLSRLPSWLRPLDQLPGPRRCGGVR
jgi:hypothetical protein